MKEGDYVVCKKDYYIDDFTFKLFRKKTFKKDSRYRIDSIKQSYNYAGPFGTSGAVGVSGVSGTSGTFPYTGTSTTTTSLASTTTSTSTQSVTCTTTTTALTTTTTTAIYTLVSYYIINGVHVSESMLKEYFYSKIEERNIKLKRLNEKEKIF